jgi:hypothetical protein
MPEEGCLLLLHLHLLNCPLPLTALVEASCASQTIVWLESEPRIRLIPTFSRVAVGNTFKANRTGNSTKPSVV